MKSTERLQSIQALLDIRGSVSVVDLAHQYQVAQETIRRDLAKLEQRGIAKKTHGGAISVLHKYEQSLSGRLTQNLAQKHSLAQAAISVIPNGSTLFIDFGTTTHIFCEYLKKLKNLTVITNSHLIATTLAKDADVDTYLLGGKYDDQIKANIGSMVIDNIHQFAADFAIIGSGGIDPEIGFSNQNVEEAAIAKVMLAQSKKTMVLADPSKFSRRGIALVAPFNQVDYLASSDIPQPIFCRILAEQGVQILTPTTQ